MAGAASQKPLALVLAVALLVAGILLLVYRVKKTTRQEEVYVTQTMICTNPDCGRFFQIKVPASKPFPEEICPYCKQRTAYRAVKCRACGGIFALKTEGGKRPSYVLLCPHCGSDNIDMDSSKIPVEEEE
jgi:ribosomal protein L40E